MKHYPFIPLLSIVMALILLFMGNELSSIGCRFYENYLNTKLFQNLYSENGRSPVLSDLYEKYNRQNLKCGQYSQADRWQGLIALKEQEMQRAVSSLTTEIQKNPDDFISNYLLGEIYKADGNSLELIEVFYKIQNIPGLRKIVEENQLSNNIEFQRIALTKLLELDPSDSWSIFRMANSYMVEDNLETAQRWYEHGINVDPAYVWNYIGLGGVFNKQENYLAAQEKYEKAILISPNDSYMYLVLGEFYLQHGEENRASDILLEGYRINPQDTSIQIDLAKIFYESNHRTDAIPFILSALGSEPNNQIDVDLLEEMLCAYTHNELAGSGYESGEEITYYKTLFRCNDGQ